MQGKHLTLEERELLFAHVEKGYSLRKIANILNVSHTSLSREYKRNCNQKTLQYFPCQAQQKARLREKLQREKAPLKNPEIFLYVKQKLRRGWSPELISGRLPIDKKGSSICTETIYQYIYAQKKHPHQNLKLYLKNSHFKRREKAGRKVRKVLIPDRVWIDQRPNEINSRQDFGHFEMDLVEGLRRDKKVINVTVERKTRFTKLSLLNSKKSLDKSKSIINQLFNLPVKSITTDNGVENTAHQDWSQKLNCPVYFTHPYHSWEKGTVENINGRLRYFLPKKTTLSSLTPFSLSVIQYLLNTTPRKCLNFQTPKECFEKELKRLKINKWCVST